MITIVSHHPPISAYYYVSPANKVLIAGELRPKSKFLGNSVTTIMEGENRVSLMGKPEDGGQSVTMPCVFLLGAKLGRPLRLLTIHIFCCIQSTASLCRTCMHGVRGHVTAAILCAALPQKW